METINVLKQFTFSVRPPAGRNGAATETVFRPGEHEIDDEMAKHPFISVHYADGCIERPEQAMKRAEAAAIKAEQTAAEAKRVNQLAEAAVARLTAQVATTTKASAEQIRRELNTPVNQLQGAQGAGIDPTEAAADEAAKKAEADAAAKAAADEVAKQAAEAAAKQAELDAAANDSTKQTLKLKTGTK